MYKDLLFFALLFLFVACHGVEEQPCVVSRCADMPEARTSAIAWAMDGKGYVFGGRDEKQRLRSDIWVYQAEKDTWQHIPTTPLQPRVNPCAAVSDGKVYIGLGFNGRIYQDTAYLTDWWSYAPDTDTWTRLADFPSRNTIGAIAYAKNGTIYCIHGFGSGFSADVYAYDIASNTWQFIARPDREEEAAMAGTGASTGSRFFYGTGYNTRSKNYWYEITDFAHWDERASVPGKRENAVCTAAAGDIFLSGGRFFGGMANQGTLYRDILRYHTDTDSWTRAGYVDQAFENGVAFTIDHCAYIGLGENSEEQVLSSLYKIQP